MSKIFKTLAAVLAFFLVAKASDVNPDSLLTWSSEGMKQIPKNWGQYATFCDGDDIGAFCFHMECHGVSDIRIAPDANQKGFPEFYYKGNKRDFGVRIPDNLDPNDPRATAYLYFKGHRVSMTYTKDADGHRVKHFGFDSVEGEEDLSLLIADDKSENMGGTGDSQTQWFHIWYSC